MAKLWERISKSFVNGVTVAAEKTEEFTKLGKAKLEILNTKRKISKSFTELGGITYDAIKTNKTEELSKKSEVKELVKTLRQISIAKKKHTETSKRKRKQRKINNKIHKNVFLIKK